MGFMFERLDVYQKTLQFTERVFDASDDFPKGFYSLVDQLRRASTSILTNLAEGNGRWHKKDRKHFFLIARASAFECVPLIELCKMRRLVTAEEASGFKSGFGRNRQDDNGVNQRNRNEACCWLEKNRSKRSLERFSVEH